MNTNVFIAFAGAAVLAVLLGCSTPQPAAPVLAAAPALPPPPEITLYSLPPIEPWPEPLPRFCKLGTSCLAMDPRPFEPCLLSTKDCRDKASEPILVGQPQWIVPPSIIETTR